MASFVSVKVGVLVYALLRVVFCSWFDFRQWFCVMVMKIKGLS